MVEAIKSIMGISYFSDYASYGDFNIRKFQMKHTELEVNLNTSAKLNEECSIPATTIDATAAVENNGNC